MHSDTTRLLVVIFAAAITSFITIAARQTMVTGRVPAAQVTHFQNERLQLVTAVRGFPIGVRDGLATLFGGGLDIADPGNEFQTAAAAAKAGLPVRRLVLGGCSMDHCLVYYERGGGARSWRVALFHWTPDVTRLEAAGEAPGGLSTIEAVRKALLSGAIKGPAKVW